MTVGTGRWAQGQQQGVQLRDKGARMGEHAEVRRQSWSIFVASGDDKCAGRSFERADRCPPPATVVPIPHFTTGVAGHSSLLLQVSSPKPRLRCPFYRGTIHYLKPRVEMFTGVVDSSLSWF